jgi:hypothetical protein
MRRLLALCALFAGLATNASASSGNRSHTSELRGIEQVTQRIRGLKAKRPVRAVFLTDKPFNAVIDAELRQENPVSEIDLSQRESVLLGLLSRHDNLRHIMFQNLSSRVIGLYDYHRKTLYVRNHGNQAFGLERYTIAHEYTHALQDQYWNLGRLTPDESKLTYRHSDADSAHAALREGDAVNTQTLFIVRTYSRAQITALIKYESHQPTGPSIPKSIDREFNFPYTDPNGGYAFVQAIYRHGGMKAVNAAFRRLPTSTYEIMHPAAYLRGWHPVAVPFHGVKGMGGWKQVDDDVNGAFGYEILLWQYLPRGVADRVTATYRGDRYVFMERGKESALRLESVWNNAKAAGAARAAIVSSLRVRYHQHVQMHGNELLTDADGAVFFRVRGARLTIVYGPNVSVARQMGTAATY